MFHPRTNTCYIEQNKYTRRYSLLSMHTVLLPVLNRRKVLYFLCAVSGQFFMLILDRNLDNYKWSDVYIDFVIITCMSSLQNSSSSLRKRKRRAIGAPSSFRPFRSWALSLGCLTSHPRKFLTLCVFMVQIAHKLINSFGSELVMFKI